MKKNVNIEDRIKGMKKVYDSLDSILDKWGDVLPNEFKNTLKKAIIGDEQLKSLMHDIDKRRAPRILLIGRTGVGKSSLINALCGKYIAKVSDVSECTTGLTSYNCMDDERLLMEIMDSRGFSETTKLNDEISAEKQVINEINEFVPDIVLFLVPANARDNLNEDADFLNEIKKEYLKKNNFELPVILVVNKVDDLNPTRIKNPSEYPDSKLESITVVKNRYKRLMLNNKLKVEDIVPVSSLIDWTDKDNNELDFNDLKLLSERQIEELNICFDGRYNINELRLIMEDSIKDEEAKYGLKMAMRLDELIKNIANNITSIFSGISATIALTPIPTSDIYILIVLQSVLVMIIAALSGEEINPKNAKEFIFGMGGIGAVANILRFAAQQISKLANGLFPGAGSTVSATIAFAGTKSIGNAAVSYYIDRKNLGEAKKILKMSNNIFKESIKTKQ